ncbi:hypothetical protein [Heyndrickxia sporothermodurans]|uniref:hypothetical protein n=1 Tax=Heyndrickxia sporothermodurans TaxID=46224 RepID=UPI000D370DAA|nr:hypothetical protein [Heyndrickxia sporothermodurans]PTY93098.1 hypothetical protein B5V90_03160 [Heyndrickxia sporothermodurans]
MATYKDILLKAAYYKEQVTKEMIMKGMFPDDRSIQDRVDRIDKFIALFSHSSVKANMDFDTESFKKALYLIYQDLSFLYQLLYEETKKEYEYVRSYADAHLKELENLAERYRLRSKLEIDSTSLGETILFQNSGFSIFNRDNAVYVDLGVIEVQEGSTLAVLFDANNVDTEQSLLGLQDSDGDIYYAAPYNYMQDTFKVPGEPVTASYSFDIDENQIVNTSFEVSAEGLAPTEKNQYLIFGGKDQVLFRNDVGRGVITKDENNSFYAREPGTIELFIYKGTYANFNFTRQPEGKNFKGNSIEDLSDYHSIVIRSDGELAFNLMTDGEVFAVMKKGIVKSSKLYYPEQSDLRSFLVEEVKPGNTKQYNAFMKIINNNEEPVDINSIAIKELFALEVAQR